ncbi:MAG: S8 family serine peptidase [Thermoplasmatales archaeon]|nr:S8 family serine peptidase [Thermoplasmatales archaeon]
MKTSKIVILTTILFLLMSLSTPTGSCTDVSVRAVKARPSTEYSPYTSWELNSTGKGIVIAFLDSGIDNEHESLKGKFVAGAAFSTFQWPPPPEDGSYDPDDTNGHGTIVAHIALGSGGTTDKDDDGKLDYTGVAPNAKLVDVVVSTGGFYTDIPDNRFTDAVQWCIDHKDTAWEGQPSEYWGIDIINICAEFMKYENSAGEERVAQILNKAVEEGLLVVVAAGNDGPNNTGFYPPASADDVIVVGGIDDMSTVIRDGDKIAEFSSRGPRADDGDDNPYDELKPDTVAPACLIMGAKYNTENEYWDEYGDGTSWAAPHVAGVVALMLEANPNLTPSVVKQILHETAEQQGTPDYSDLSGKYNRSYGYGIVDAYEAVKAALAWRPPNNPPTVSIASPKNNAEVSDTITISGTALDTDGNVTNVELRFDDNDWFNVPIVSANNINWNYSWDTKDVVNGMHTIYAKCFDGENYSVIQSVDVNVYNKVSVGDIEEETKINPVYLISGAGIIGAVVIIVVCLLLFRRKRLAGLPVSVPPPAPPPVSQPVPFVTAKCPNCGNIIQITTLKRPLRVICPKCGVKSILR